MNILKNLFFIFIVTLATNIQASQSARHVKFKLPLSTRHKYEVESLTAYRKELREHNLQISMQQTDIIHEMTEEEQIELTARQAALIVIKEQQKAFLEPYDKINNVLNLRRTRNIQFSSQLSEYCCQS